MKIAMQTHSAGFTLVEILIAMTIFSIGILGVVALQVSSIQGNSFSRCTSEATALGQGKIEDLMGRDYDDPQLQVSDPPLSEVTEGYTLTWTVTEDATLSNTKNVSIQVAWGERGGTKTVTVQGIKADLL